MNRMVLSFLVLVFCLGPNLTMAQAKFKTPWLSGPVIDEVGILSPEHKAELERLLVASNQQGIAQIQVFITSSLQGLPIEQASIEITDEWKLGSKEKDNGMLFLIAPNEKKMRLEVGQGLEGVMPDIYAKRITEDVVVPYFKKGQLSEGVYEGVKAIFAVIGGQSMDSVAPERESNNGGGVAIPMWIMIPLWILIIILSRFGGGGGRRYRGGGGGWSGGGYGGGGFSSGGGGSSWSGGGGGFSGGGSSSSW